MANFSEPFTVRNRITANDLEVVNGITRDQFAVRSLAEYQIPWDAWRVHDAYQTNLPGTPATDDLGLIGGTFGTASPMIQTEDLAQAGATTSYARAQVHLPADYEDGDAVQINVRAGMVTTISDGTATVDFEVYKIDKQGTVGSDIMSTGATSINSLLSASSADLEFIIDETGLVRGDTLDVRMALDVSDALTGTPVIAAVSYVALACDVRG